MAKRMSAAARTNVSLEDIRSQNRAVMEVVLSSKAELQRSIAEQFAEVNRRLTLLEDAVRQNSRDILKNSEDIRQNSEDIRKNSEDIRQNSEDIRKNTEDIQRNTEDIRKNSEDIRQLRSEVDALRVEVRQLRSDFERREELARLQSLEERVARLETQLRSA